MGSIIVSNIINLIVNVLLLVAGLIAIKKIPFFTTKLNQKKSNGKRFVKLGWIWYFISKIISGLIVIVINNIGGIPLPQIIFTILGIFGYIGIAYLIIGAIRLYQGSKSDTTDEEINEKPKKAAFTANEEMSQKAQYAYTNFRNEYEQGATAIDEVAEAKMFAKAVQLQLLKTPASAVFCSMEEMSVLPIGDGAYSVSGYVDSQNSYGAMLRNQFNLTVFKDENGIWKNANRFISTAASINSSIISHTILWWVLGIIGTIITLAVSYLFTSSMF